MIEKPTLGPTGPNPVAEEQFRKAFEQAKSGDLDEAILSLDAALAVSPEEGRYHDLLGTLYAKKGLYEMAVAAWKRSVECDPEHGEVYRRIETAEKMRVQAPPAGSKWNWVAIGVLAFCMVAATAWGTYQSRKKGADLDRLANLEAVEADLKENHVPKSEVAELQERYDRLAASVQVKDSSLTIYKSRMADFETSGKFVLQSELQKEQELRNRVQSELAASRQERDRLAAEVAATQNATGAQSLSAQVTQRDNEIKALNESYQKLNGDRSKLEAELKASRDQGAQLTKQVADLKVEVSQRVSAGEAAQLKTEIQDLKVRLAKAETAVDTSPGPSTPPEDVLFLVNHSLEAVRSVVDGDKEGAARALRLVEEKAPSGLDLKPTLEKLSSPAQLAEASPPEVPQPEPMIEPTATPVPKPSPTPKPTRKPAEKKPTPKPQPTKAPAVVSKPKETPKVTVPKPVDTSPAAAAEVAKSARTVPKEEPKATTSEPDRVDTREDLQRKRMYQRKVTLTNQALELYKQRRFEEASRAINEAYRIDPKDPRVNQLRSKIREVSGN